MALHGVVRGPGIVGRSERPDAEGFDRSIRAVFGSGIVNLLHADDQRETSRDVNAPAFREPWEAQAFALAVTLRERGIFSATEWAATLGDEIKRAQAAGDPDTGETYYRHWLATLERIVAEKGVTDARQLARTRHAWEHACERTPHGTPIELRRGDFHD